MTLAVMMPRITDPDRFQKIAAGTQAILVSLAVLIGGGWTLYTFNSQLQVENAQAQLRKLKRELETEPKIEILLEARQFLPVKTNRYVVVGAVTVKNVGSATTALVLEDEPVHVYRVEFEDSGTESWLLVRKLRLRATDKAPISVLMAHASAVNAAAFSTFVTQPGLYVVRFAAQRRTEEVAAAFAVAPKTSGEGGTVEWSTHAYFIVK